MSDQAAVASARLRPCTVAKPTLVDPKIPLGDDQTWMAKPGGTGARREAKEKLALQTQDKLALQAQRDRTRLRLEIVDKVHLTIRQLVFWSAIVLCVYFGVFRTAEVLAGKETTFSSTIRWLLDLKMKDIALIVTSITTTGAYVYEKRSKKKLIRRMGTRQSQLERLIDPKRSSSNLLPDGSARKEDIDD